VLFGRWGGKGKIGVLLVLCFDAAGPVLEWVGGSVGAGLAPARGPSAPQQIVGEQREAALRTLRCHPLGRPHPRFSENHLGCPSQVGGPDSKVRPLLMLFLL